MSRTSSLVSIEKAENNHRPNKVIDDAEKARLVKQIEEILGPALDGSETSIRRAAEDIGLRIITQKQFKVMQWGTRQLKIRRLQNECDRILREIST